MNQETIDELLIAYLSGNSSEENTRLAEEWINSSESNHALFEEYKKIWISADNMQDHFTPDIEKAWAKIARAVKLGEQETKILKMGKPASFYIRRIAASVILIAGLGFLITFMTRNKGTVEYASGSEPKMITLPDSSKIWLNKDSKLILAADFNTNDRELDLDGEAFFDVAKDPSRPFIIHSGTSYTKVLGTSFNVNARHPEEQVIVSVHTGRVEFGIENKANVVLLPGEEGIANTVAKSVSMQPIANNNHLSWKTRELSFDDELLSSVFAQLEAMYNIRIEADSGLSYCHYTGSFSNVNLDQCLKVLSLSNSFEYTAKGSRVIIKGEGCHN